MKKTFPASVFSTKEDLISLKKKAEAFKLKKSDLPVLTGTGEHASPFKTKGLDFQEVRVYQPGDDIRLIDWRITAKHNKPYTKLFTDEKERQVFVFVDMQQSMKFATKGMFKSVVAAKTAALLSFLAINQQDKIGFTILFDNKIECFFSNGGKETIVSFFDALEEAGNPVTGETPSVSFAEGLIKSEKFIKKGALVFILSDFYQLDDEATNIITRLSKKATCSLFDIYDSIEKEFPKGVFPVSNGEEILFLNTKSKSFQKKYQTFLTEKTTKLNNLTNLKNMGYLSLNTNEDFLTKIASYCNGGLL